MDKVALLTSFISLALEVQVNVWDGRKESLVTFEKRNCFLPDIQSQLTAEVLELFVGAVKKQVIYEIRDVLGLRVFLLLFENNVIIIGPFVEEQWNDAKARELLATLKIPISYELQYKLYYCGYNERSIKTTYRTIYAAACSLNPKETNYEHRIVQGFNSNNIHNTRYDNPPELDVIETRYRYENEFMRMIQQGNPKAALDMFTRMSTMSGVLHGGTPILQDSLERAAVGRTLMRKAAEQVGLRPTVIDSISQAHAQKLRTAKSNIEIFSILQSLVNELSGAVRDMLMENFTPHVRKAADYIRLHLSNPLTLDEISGTLGITPNHLSHLFKKEAGVSVSQYIAEKRCRSASDLLLTTTLSVQDVSAYVGYLDSNYFIKVFKSQIGVTPTEYRKQNKLQAVQRKD